MPQKAYLFSCTRQVFRETFFWLILASKYIRPILGLTPSERIVEYPWILKNIRKGKLLRTLDVGCSGSFLSHELIARGYDVYGIDFNEYLEKHPNLKFHRLDIVDTSFPKNFFDQVVMVSTLEHIGIGTYGDPKYEDGDNMTMNELSRILKKDGLMLITVPFSNRHTSGEWYRVYDMPSLKKLVEAAHLRFECIEWYVLSGNRWFKFQKHSDILEEHKTAKAIACLRLRKKRHNARYLGFSDYHNYKGPVACVSSVHGNLYTNTAIQ